MQFVSFVRLKLLGKRHSVIYNLNSTHLMMYRQSFPTEELAKAFCATLIYGGVIQQQDHLWHVWQLNS